MTVSYAKQFQTKVLIYFDFLAQYRSILLISFAFQTLWMFVCPLNAGWDTVGYLGVARWITLRPPNMWNLYKYYSPGFPMILVLSRVLRSDTFQLFRIVHYLMGVLMPVLLFESVKYNSKRLAICITLFFILSGAPYFYSYKIMTDHSALFFLLLTLCLFTRFYHTRSKVILAILSISFFVTSAIRPINMYLIILLGIFIGFSKFYTLCLDRIKSLAILLLPFGTLLILCSTYISQLRGDGFHLSITRDLGARVLFVGAYTSAQYFHNPQGVLAKGTQDPLVIPQNGPATKKIFELMKQRATKEPSLIQAVNSKLKNVDEMIDFIIHKPIQSNFYHIWWSLDGLIGERASEKLMKKAVFETFLAHPMKLSQYYVSSFFNFLFGPKSRVYGEDRIINYKGYAVDTSVNTEFLKEIMSPLIGQGRALQELTLKQPNGPVTIQLGSILEKIGSFLFDLRPFLSLMTFAGVFLAPIGLSWPVLCSILLFYFSSLTALALPAQIPYWLPAFPFMIIGCMVTLKLIFDQFYNTTRIDRTFE